MRSTDTIKSAIRAIDEAVKTERERCAKVAEGFVNGLYTGPYIADAIRYGRPLSSKQIAALRNGIAHTTGKSE